MTTTGWPPGMLQDDSRELSRWLANRPGVLYQLSRNDMGTDKLIEHLELCIADPMWPHHFEMHKDTARMLVKALKAPAAPSEPVAEIPQGFTVTHCVPWDALTDEANAEARYLVRREVAPFATFDGERQWTGPTLGWALAKACAALGLPSPQPSAKPAGDEPVFHLRSYGDVTEAQLEGLTKPAGARDTKGVDAADVLIADGWTWTGWEWLRPPAPAATARLTDARLWELRAAAKSDPRTMDQHWFILFARAVLAEAALASTPAEAQRGELQQLAQIASAAMHQSAADQRNTLEDIADRLSAISAPDAPAEALAPEPVAPTNDLKERASKALKENISRRTCPSDDWDTIASGWNAALGWALKAGLLHDAPAEALAPEAASMAAEIRALMLKGEMARAMCLLQQLQDVLASIPAPVKAVAVVGNEFQRAWLQLPKLPGGMMHSSVAGEFGPVPASCSAWVTTSEKEMKSWNEPSIEVWITRPPAAQGAPVMAEAVDIEAAAKQLAESFDYPWEEMPVLGRKTMREHAWAVLKAAGVKG